MFNNNEISISGHVKNTRDARVAFGVNQALANQPPSFVVSTKSMFKLVSIDDIIRSYISIVFFWYIL